MYGAEPRYNDLRYNDVPGLMMGMSLTERKIFSVITIKSISQSTGTRYELYKLFLTCFKDIKEYSGCCNSFDDHLQIY